MRSILHRSTGLGRAVALALLPMLLLASGCATSAGFPPLADVTAAAEPKPAPDDAIATDPVAEAHYNARVESWGDRLGSAGARLCRFFLGLNMPGLKTCPPAATLSVNTPAIGPESPTPR